MTDFKVGDRVRIKASEAEGYIQPFRRFAETGRPATVKYVYKHRSAVSVRFDVTRKNASPKSLFIGVNNLELVP